MADEDDTSDGEDAADTGAGLEGEAQDLQEEEGERIVMRCVCVGKDE